MQNRTKQTYTPALIQQKVIIYIYKWYDYWVCYWRYKMQLIHHYLCILCRNNGGIEFVNIAHAQTASMVTLFIIKLWFRWIFDAVYGSITNNKIKLPYLFVTSYAQTFVIGNDHYIGIINRYHIFCIDTSWLTLRFEISLSGSLQWPGNQP